MRGVATLPINQYGEYQLSAIKNTGELMKKLRIFSRIQSQIQKAFRYRLTVLRVTHS
jgi:hypothetical protein